MLESGGLIVDGGGGVFLAHIGQIQNNSHYKYTNFSSFLTEGTFNIWCLFIAAVPRTVSERTQCRHVMPLAQEWVSSDPAPRRSGSPPRSSAGELETDQGEMNEMTMTIEWIELEKEGVGIRACENKH